MDNQLGAAACTSSHARTKKRSVVGSGKAEAARRQTGAPRPLLSLYGR
jgi:hypothetical protein